MKLSLYLLGSFLISFILGCSPFIEIKTISDPVFDTNMESRKVTVELKVLDDLRRGPLKKQNFLVLENKHPTKITTFKFDKDKNVYYVTFVPQNPQSSGNIRIVVKSNRKIGKSKIFKFDPVDDKVLLKKDWDKFRTKDRESNILDMTSNNWKSFSAHQQKHYAQLYQKAYARAIGIARGTKDPRSFKKVEFEKDIKIKMILVPPGRYNQGDIDAFLISETEITEEVWNKYCEPSREETNKFPVIVSFQEAKSFCENVKLSELKSSRLELSKLELPKQSEWEYACRAGNIGDYCFSDEKENNTNTLGKFAWFISNSKQSLQCVRTRKSNYFGIYDMHGNVAEWCVKNNPKSQDSTKSQLEYFCGGSFKDYAEFCRSNSHQAISGRHEDIGFRPILRLSNSKVKK